MSIVLRRIVTVNGNEIGPNVLLSISAVRATGKRVESFCAHRRSGFPERPNTYNARVKHERHIAKIERIHNV